MNELSEIIVALNSHKRGPAAGQKWVDDMSERLGKMFSVMLAGSTGGATSSAPPAGRVYVCKLPANQTGQRTLDLGNPARLKTAA